MSRFDENAAADADSGIFGLPHSEKEAAVICIPVPWEATTSYGGGTSQGPRAIIEASRQVDLFDWDVVDPWRAGIHARSESSAIRKMNTEARRAAKKIIARGGRIRPGDRALLADLKKVNALGEKLNAWVRAETEKVYRSGKIPCILGGDHSTPFGGFEATADQFGAFGILHIDAHSDTRDAYEGFTWSHASIMRNALERIPQVVQLTQLGIRDFCREEYEYCVGRQKTRVKTYYDRDLARRRTEGEPFSKVAAEVISTLPERVWISFDIDGLDPRFCPHTGTPVPGGLDYNDAILVLTLVAHSGRKIVGFDLNEVAPNPSDENDQWDGNVAARLVYKMCALALASQSRAEWRLSRLLIKGP